jgi:hypothetical protein
LDGRRFLVESDTETFQLIGDDGQVVQRFQDVEHNEDEIASSRYGNDLSTSTFSILGSLDDSCQSLSGDVSQQKGRTHLADPGPGF